MEPKLPPSVGSPSSNDAVMAAWLATCSSGYHANKYVSWSRSPAYVESPLRVKLAFSLEAGAGPLGVYSQPYTSLTEAPLSRSCSENRPGLQPRRTHWWCHGRRLTRRRLLCARLAICGALGGGSANEGAPEPRSLVCRQLKRVSRPKPNERPHRQWVELTNRSPAGRHHRRDLLQSKWKRTTSCMRRALQSTTIF